MDSLRNCVNRKNYYSCQPISKKVPLFQKELFIRDRHNPCDIAHTGCTIAEYDGAHHCMCCDFLHPLSTFARYRIPVY